MKIAVYTLTRDRLPYTIDSFASLRVNAGMDFTHVVLDNGSADGTQDWLQRVYKPKGLILSAVNLGISAGSNRALDRIFEMVPDVDLIVKMDNDCRIVTPNLFNQMAECFERRGRYAAEYILSPRVEGINKQPRRARATQLAGREVGLTAIVGGLCHCVPRKLYQSYRFPLDLPLASGQDDHFCHWAKRQGAEVGYVEGLVVEHIDGTDMQAVKFPGYFERKWQEEKTHAGS